MDMRSIRRPLLAFAGFLTLTISGWAAAEPPSRVARLAYISGTVSFSPAGQPDWVQAAVNRPLTTGDRLWTDADSRAELQIGGATIRLGDATSVTLLNLDDRIAQVELAQGTLKVRVRRMGPDQIFEVDTPNLAFTMRRPGEYRIEVSPNDDSTAVMVQRGQAEAYGEGASYAVNSQRGYRFYGTGLSDYEVLAVQRDDDLDLWARERDRRNDNSLSARYVSAEVVGYEDLDANGTWRVDPDYGNIWMPSRVAAGWTPYRDGHWAWIDPWGWTWVDDAPWGYAVSHYGRWANIRGSWGWVPGPPREQAVYAPALVAFVGGKNFQVAVSVGSVIAALGWFPLAPREVYRPAYQVSRRYFDHINRSNTVIASTTITNVYNTINTTTTTNITNVVYANQRVTGAVVAVPTQAFVQSQPVAKVAMPVSKAAAASAPPAHIAAVAPVQQSMHGGAPNVGAKPPTREQAIVAHTAPPAPPLPFAVQQKQLAAKPGAPIDEAQRTQLKPAAPIVAGPKVSVVTAIPAPAPTALPPATPPAGKSPDRRKADAGRSDAAKADTDTAKAEAAKSEASRADAAKAEAARVDAAKDAAARNEASRADAAKADAARAAAAKSEASRADAAKAEAARADAMRAEAAKAEAARAAAARNEASRADAAKADAARAAAAKSEASRADAAKAEAARADAMRAEAAKAEAAKAEVAKAEAARAEAARAAAARAAAARNEASRADAARAAAASSEASRADAARAAAASSEASRADAAKAEAARAASVAAPVAPPVAHPPAAKPSPGAKDEKEKRKAEEEQKH